MNKLIVLLFVLLTQTSIAQITIDKNFKTLKVTGDMKSLSVIGEEREKAIIEMSNEADASDQVQISKLLNTVTVDINEPDIDFVIRVPKGSDVVVETDDIVFEGMFDMDRDQRVITIQDLDGTIDVTTDGYAVNLSKNSSDMSVVSYMNIFADSISVLDDASISMDSYWGDVHFGAYPPLDAMIKMRAKQGTVELDSLLILSDEIMKLDGNVAVITGDGRANIMLHSERGDQVLFDLESMQHQMDLMHEELNFLKLSDRMVEGYMLSNNEPDPWKRETKIEYYLPEDGRVFFEFFDVEGKTIYSLTEEGKKGLNKLTINRKMIPELGSLYYQMKSGDFKQTRKMIHID